MRKDKYATDENVLKKQFSSIFSTARQDINPNVKPVEFNILLNEINERKARG